MHLIKMSYTLKVIVHKKINTYLYSVIIYLPQSSMNFYILIKTKEDILKNMGNQIIHWPH